MKTSKIRRTYEPQFKQDALNLAEKIGPTKTSQQLNIPLSCLQRWKSQKNIPVEKSKDILLLQKEVKKLKKQLLEEKAIVEMLKKTTAFFSKENLK